MSLNRTYQTWSLVEKRVILDKSLSWGAKGLYSYLEIIKECYCFDDFPEDLVKELVDFGYLISDKEVKK